MGSPAASGKEDERPQIQVQVPPFWMGKYEITWSQYKPFMELYEVMKKFESKQIRVVTDANLVDAITIPTKLYDPSFTFEKGENPASAGRDHDAVCRQAVHQVAEPH